MKQYTYFVKLLSRNNIGKETARKKNHKTVGMSNIGKYRSKLF